MAFVAALALLMGLPNLSGSFVGGDDHRLLLNHVFVNHPSLEHAARIFTIFHRDLYQPLPLLSFSMEFALARALGLFEKGVDAAGWLFHLTNILLHAINAVLVWRVVLRLQDREGARSSTDSTGTGAAASSNDRDRVAMTVATVTAAIFAIHPFQTEVVAWTNGRMMLLSTLFALLSLLQLAAFVDRPRARPACLALLFTLLCAVSKVRIALPVLWGVLLVARGVKLRRRVLLLWGAASVVTAVFVVVNVISTSQASLFSEAGEHLHGPRVVRVLLALAFYFQHLVWPTGLSSYYPTPPTVYWSDPETWRAVAIVVPTLALLGWVSLRSRAALLGIVWFFAALAVTLPILPARNVLAADRYMYLPIIGLLFAGVGLGHEAYRRWLMPLAPRAARMGLTLAGVAVGIAFIGICWHVAGFYTTPLRKTLRITQLFPDTPRVWEPLGWTYFSDGRYAEAMDCADKELRHDAPSVRGGAYQLLGMSQFRLGNFEKGLELLRTAIEVSPTDSRATSRIAGCLEELGRLDEATRYYEDAVEAAPIHNPSIDNLAAIYARMGRRADARAMYERAQGNNRYDVVATMGLVRLEIAENTRESYLSAEARLLGVLKWMPENAEALTNLGAVRVALGRPDEAVACYNEALRYDPRHITALLNLAQLHAAADEPEHARPLFERAIACGMTSIDEVKVVHTFLVSQRDYDHAVALWSDFAERRPTNKESADFLTWARVLGGDGVRASSGPIDDEPTSPLILAARAYQALREGHGTAAAELVDRLADAGRSGADARRRLLAALERFDEIRPDVPWMFCLGARLLFAEGNHRAAEAFVGLCEQRCREHACREQAASLRLRLRPAPVNPPLPQP